jgi:hypothetical protein
VPTGESGEFTVQGVNSAKLSSCGGCANVNIYPGESNVTVSFMQNAGMSLVELGDGSRVVLLDRSAAYLFWSPALNNNPSEAGNDTSEFESGNGHAQIFDMFLVLVHGPYLVRSATLNDKSLALTGDVANATTITVFTSKSVCSISWNGKKLPIASSNAGILTAKLDAAPDFDLPALSGWKYADSLPEIQSGYSANSSAWIGKSSWSQY